ncbi:uncharacterized protein C8R40DRAFT_1178147 [Lentinula edodes]|uniref:uncharacterized protein n=1 Tax=Lentinula edodes TaxID=5353 RepID=UPI001E8CDA5F|nr:uncharacterized protein C8R40DRAFT_1178147 [Lentinula edodes]KAH7868208.1 hypothetical protein C8R40DRAFT_1178147 [Lentinula edodes]
MPSVEHFAALIEFDDPNLTTSFVLPSLIPVVLPKSVQTFWFKQYHKTIFRPLVPSDELQGVEAVPRNEASRTLTLNATVLAYDQSNPMAGPAVHTNQQHSYSRANIGNDFVDIYGASTANFLNTAFPMPVAPPDGGLSHKEGALVQAEPGMNKYGNSREIYDHLLARETNSTALENLEQNDHHAKEHQVKSEPQSISSALRFQRQARRQSPYLIRPQCSSDSSERQSLTIETDSHSSQHSGFVPSEYDHAIPRYRQEKVRSKDVTTSWYTYRTLGSLASPPDFPYNHSGLKHNDIFLHINEDRRAKLNGAMQLSELLNTLCNAEEAWHEETGRRTDYMSRLCHSTEEERRAMSQLTIDANNFLSYVDSIAEGYRGTFASLHQKCRSSGIRLAQDTLRNASILREVNSKSYQLQEQLLEDMFLRKSLTEQVEFAHSKEISSPKAKMKENGAQIVLIMARFQEVLKVLATNLGIDPSSRYSMQPLVVRHQVPEVSASCASACSIERQMEWNIVQPRTSQPRMLESRDWDHSEDASDHTYIDVKEGEDLTSKFLEMKKEKLRMVLNSVEYLRIDGQKLVSQVEKANERLQVLRDSHRERLDVLNDYAENLIERTEQKLNVLQIQPPDQTTDNVVLEFGQAHTTEYLGELWTIALRALTSRSSKDARKMQSKEEDRVVSSHSEDSEFHSSFLTGIGVKFVEPCLTKRPQSKPNANGQLECVSTKAIRSTLSISVHTPIEEIVGQDTSSLTDPLGASVECTTPGALDSSCNLSTSVFPPLVVWKAEEPIHSSRCVISSTPECPNEQAEGSLEVTDHNEEHHARVVALNNIAYSWTTLLSSAANVSAPPTTVHLISDITVRLNDITVRLNDIAVRLNDITVRLRNIVEDTSYPQL